MWVSEEPLWFVNGYFSFHTVNQHSPKDWLIPSSSAWNIQWCHRPMHRNASMSEVKEWKHQGERGRWFELMSEMDHGSSTAFSATHTQTHTHRVWSSQSKASTAHQVLELKHLTCPGWLVACNVNPTVNLHTNDHERTQWAVLWGNKKWKNKRAVW